MTNYRVITGYIEMKNYDEDGELVEKPVRYPLSVFNVMSDNQAIINYLIKELGVDFYQLQEQKRPPIYLTHQLN